MLNLWKISGKCKYSLTDFYNGKSKYGFAENIKHEMKLGYFIIIT